PSEKPKEWTTRPAGREGSRARRRDQASTHRGLPGPARSGTASEPDPARAHPPAGQRGPGRDRALLQTRPGSTAARPPATAAGEWHSSAAPMTGTEPRRPSTRSRLRPVPEPDQQPPHNLEAEEAVLGAVLAAGQLLAEVAGLVEEADFYRPAHRAIWRAMLRLADRGEPTDPVTVLGELDHAGELADVGGGPFLHTLVEAVPTVANASRYAQLVAEAAPRRRVIDLGIQLVHSDADPGVLAHLAGELADTRTGLDGRLGP